jgi:hypothetical protein
MIDQRMEVEDFSGVEDRTKYPFVIVDVRIIESPALDLYEKMVYLALKRFAGFTTQTCYPSYARIASMIGCSSRQVIDKIKGLEAKGFIAIERRKDEVKGNMSNVYVILEIPETTSAVEPCRSTPTPSEPHSQGGVNDMHHPCERDAPPLCTTFTPLMNDVHPNNIHSNKSTLTTDIEQQNQETLGEIASGQPVTVKRQKAPALKSADSVLCDEFLSEVWGRYPNKRGRADAMRWYVKWRKNGHTKDEIIKAVDNYRSECEKEARPERWILHGSTFFGPEERWKEYVDGIPKCDVREQSEGCPVGPLSMEESFRRRNPALSKRLDEIRAGEAAAQ